MLAASIFLNIALQSSVNPNLFNNYMILGYMVMGIIGLVYIASLAMRQRNLRQDIQLLEHLLEDEEAS